MYMRVPAAEAAEEEAAQAGEVPLPIPAAAAIRTGGHPCLKVWWFRAAFSEENFRPDAEKNR